MPDQPAPDFLVHRKGDVVGVAVRDLAPGPATGGFLHGDESVTVDVIDAVPLGHKVAIADLAQGSDVLEYGVRTAVASAPIAIGQHVHVHNVRSARWQTSVA